MIFSLFISPLRPKKINTTHSGDGKKLPPLQAGRDEGVTQLILELGAASGV
jgi:hypothetical protein